MRRILVISALLLTACTQAPPAPPPGPDLAKISTAAHEAVDELFTEGAPSPVAPCELRRTAHVQVSSERGKTVELKAPAQLSAGHLEILYLIYPAPDNLLADLADLAGVAQACHPRKVSQIVTPRQGNPFVCRSDVATTATMDGPILKVMTDAVPVPAPAGGEWTTNEKGLLVPPPDLGKPTCGTGVSYGQANFFAVKNGLAIQVIKPVDPAGISQVDERPAALSTAAQTETMEAMEKLLAALPS